MLILDNFISWIASEVLGVKIEFYFYMGIIVCRFETFVNRRVVYWTYSGRIAPLFRLILLNDSLPLTIYFFPSFWTNNNFGFSFFLFYILILWVFKYQTYTLTGSYEVSQTNQQTDKKHKFNNLDFL